ncbi:hypothetical protein F0562_015852 [Nyssa sinensis]|uniref:18 kDa seed maturation protein n=1 Tax=Nyssa sinensis TaxID=561372 RepID=A0A5J4ZI72_9ASTE|nr:hypothetical protein F0562_015852 [Nyssa sinensis]
MQGAKNTVASGKETAANVAASAKSGMDKTKATVQEKVERLNAHDTTQKEMATEKKEEKIHQAELNKLEAREQNAAARQGEAAGGGTQSYTVTGVTGTHQASNMPGYAGTGQHAAHGYTTTGVTGTPQMSTTVPEHVTGQTPVESVMGSQYPPGANTGTGRTSVPTTHVGGGATPGYGTGGTYS